MEEDKKILTGAEQTIKSAQEEEKVKAHQKLLRQMQAYYLATLASGWAHRVHSVRRSLRRGKIGPSGLIHRPFNNRKNTCTRTGHTSRFVTELKKKNYYDSFRRINNPTEKEAVQ